MPVWDIHHSDLLDQRIGHVLRDVKWESFHFDGARKPGVYRLYLYFDKWLSVFDDAGAWFINDLLPEARQVVGEGDISIQWHIHESQELAPSLRALLGKRLTGFVISPDKEGFQLTFEGGSMITLSSGKLGEGGGVDEGFDVSVSP